MVPLPGKAAKVSATLINTKPLAGDELSPPSTGEQLWSKCSYLLFLPTSPNNALSRTPARREQEQLPQAPYGHTELWEPQLPVNSYQARRWHSTTYRATLGLCMPPRPPFCACQTISSTHQHLGESSAVACLYQAPRELTSTSHSQTDVWQSCPSSAAVLGHHLAPSSSSL